MAVPVRVLLWLVPLMFLSGCTQLDDAKQAADDAKAKLEEAKLEAQEARDRLDRFKSATVVRSEQLRVVIVPMSNETEIWFDTGAWRGEFLVPGANVTSLPAVRVRFAEADFRCDPLSCRLARPESDVNVTWADGAPGGVTLVRGTVGCEPANVTDAYCRIGELTRERGAVQVTTAAGDITD